MWPVRSISGGRKNPAWMSGVCRWPRAMPVQVPQFRQRHVIPSESHPQPPGRGTLLAVAVGAMAQRLRHRLRPLVADQEATARRCIHFAPRPGPPTAPPTSQLPPFSSTLAASSCRRLLRSRIVQQRAVPCIRPGRLFPAIRRESMTAAARASGWGVAESSCFTVLRPHPANSWTRAQVRVGG